VTEKSLAAWKLVPDGLAEHAGEGGRLVMLDPECDSDGLCHVGLINPAIGVGLELEYPLEQLPRFNNWQHLGPRGSYVSGIEPYAGSLWGKRREEHPLKELYLEPGETKRYQLTIRVHQGKDALNALAKHDGPVRA